MNNREDKSQPDIGQQESSDETRPPFGGSDSSTTYDVSNEAEKALQQFISQREDNREDEEVQGDQFTVRIQVKDAETPVVIIVKREVVIGRRDPTTSVTPDLDLTPYGGYQMGISRQHALLNIIDNRLVITDVGSRNGTYLNGYRLEANQPVRLHDGDEVRLGKIVFHLYIQHRL